MEQIDQPIIAYDESGNTGADLLDLDQPVFILASAKLTMSQANELRSIIQSPAQELKFNRLKKYGKYHSQILSLLNHDYISADSVNIGVFHKAYCICGFTADRLVEPVIYMSGMDFYQGGENIAYCNLLYYCIPVFCGKELFERYQIDFITLFQKRDPDSIEKFYATVVALMEASKSEQFKDALLPILFSREIIPQVLAEFGPYDFDTTLSAFVNSVDYWGRRTVGNFDAYVDDSKALRHFQHYVEVIKQINVEEEIGSDRRTLQLPLKLKNIHFTDSKQNMVVQIADLIAGAANHYYRSLVNPKFEDELSRKIGESKIASLLISPVWPTPAVTPEDLNTPLDGKKSIIDGLTSLIQSKDDAL